MVDEHWLARAGVVVRTRYVHGSPQEDERVRHGRSGGAFMVLGAISGMCLLPVLPPEVDDTLAFLLASGCLLMGVVLPWLPWARWPRPALLLPIAATLPVVFVGGGVVDGTLDYYALYLPLVFCYLGLVFPLVYCAWTFLVCMLGLLLAVTVGDSPHVVPQVLLGSVLSAVTGAVVALQRRAQSQGYDAMRSLAEAATMLGSATDRQQVADVVAAAAREILGGGHVEVLLPADDAEPAGTAVPATLFSLVVPIPSSTCPAGAITVRQRRRAHGIDHLAVRSLDLLAGEAGHVLDRIRRTDELVTSSRTDALTGVGNRTVLREAMDASTPGDVFILVDLDHFKRVNDTLGHARGDQVLVAFAQVLRGSVRLNQVVARYGGEEFAMILPQADEVAVRRHLRNVRKAWAARDQQVTFSSGIAVRRDGESAAEAMGRADKALYLAKSGGRDQDVCDGADTMLDQVAVPGPSA